MDLKSVMKVEPIHDEYQDREARLRVMDEQGLGAALFFPTQGVGVEECLVDDPEAAVHCLSAFNKWLEEDWGFAFDNRIFAIPMITLADPLAALAELESLIDRGAKGVHLRPAPVPSVEGPRSFGHPAHDPVWGAIADADIPVFFHLGDSGYLREARAWGSRAVYDPFRPEDPLNKVLVSDRAIHDTIASVIAHGVFHRHPKLRVGSIENGSDWVARVGKRLSKAANQAPTWFPDDPVEVLRNHVWVSPYYEDDLEKLAETIGVDRILFGSDWPHGEGLASPLQFTKDLTPFSPRQVRKIMRDNVLDLMGSRVMMSE
jgi:predicted TIM-barrel fold metal-dependent hydrolase